MNYKLFETVEVLHDIDRITQYMINVLLSKQAAQDFLYKLKEKYIKICKNPYGYEEQQFGKYWYRKAVVGKYIIAFRIDEQTHTVYIVAIGHSLQKRKNIVKH